MRGNPAKIVPLFDPLPAANTLAGFCTPPLTVLVMLFAEAM